MEQLPVDVLAQILRLQPFDQRVQHQLVCKTWYHASTGLWRSVVVPGSYTRSIWCGRKQRDKQAKLARRSFLRCLSANSAQVEELALLNFSHGVTGQASCSMPARIGADLLAPLGCSLRHLVLYIPSLSHYRGMLSGLRHCVALQSLSLSVHSIPNEEVQPLATCTTLRSLVLQVRSPVCLTSLYHPLSRLTRLEQLQLAVDNRQQCELPSWIGHAWQDLTLLSLRGLNIPEMPQHIVHLQALQDLDISFNYPPLPPTAFPLSLKPMTALSRLVLHNSISRVLPSVITQLTALRTLDVAYNTDVVHSTDRCNTGSQPLPVPSTWQQQQAHAHGNAQQVPHGGAMQDSPRLLAPRLGLLLPPSLAPLSLLADMCLSSNALRAQQLTTLASLTSLVRLDLSACGLRCVPDSVTGLRCLTSIDLSGNKLQELPLQLLQLPMLRCAAVAGNPSMVLGINTLEYVLHPHLQMLDIRRSVQYAPPEAGLPDDWDLGSIVVLFELLRLVLYAVAGKKVHVGCKSGVRVHFEEHLVYEGIFGGPAMHAAIAEHQAYLGSFGVELADKVSKLLKRVV